MKNTKIAAERWPSMSPRMANQTMAATGISRNAARSHWKRGSSDSTVSAMIASVPATTSRLVPHEPRRLGRRAPDVREAFRTA